MQNLYNINYVDYKKKMFSSILYNIHGNNKCIWKTFVTIYFHLLYPPYHNLCLFYQFLQILPSVCYAVETTRYVRFGENYIMQEIKSKKIHIICMVTEQQRRMYNICCFENFFIYIYIFHISYYWMSKLLLESRRGHFFFLLYFLKMAYYLSFP